MPILAWLSFCERYEGECAIDPSEPATIPLTQRTLQLLVEVTKRVNTGIRGVSDFQHWGISDQWDLPMDGRGDCEDYQLLKRKLLAEAGLPRRAMRMAVVSDHGEGHAVLLIRTDRGDVVLDNKVSTVLHWSETPYTFVKRESEDAVEWVSLRVDSTSTEHAELRIRPPTKRSALSFNRAWPWPALEWPSHLVREGWQRDRPAFLMRAYGSLV